MTNHTLILDHPLKRLWQYGEQDTKERRKKKFYLIAKNYENIIIVRNYVISLPIWKQNVWLKMWLMVKVWF